jgi:prepilin-type N-terminal cleavage/methylation domain-containing protein
MVYRYSTRGFTLIELLVVIAIIGILSAVVLASLNTARQKGSDAAVKSDLDTVRTQSVIYLDSSSNKYSSTGTAVSGVNCGVAAGQITNTMLTDSSVKNALQAAYSANGNQALYCNINSAGSAFAIAAPLASATSWWCIDSTGVARGTQAGGTTGYTGLSGSPSAALSDSTDTICN